MKYKILSPLAVDSFYFKSVNNRKLTYHTLPIDQDEEDFYLVQKFKDILLYTGLKFERQFVRLKNDEFHEIQEQGNQKLSEELNELLDQQLLIGKVGPKALGKRHVFNKLITYKISSRKFPKKYFGFTGAYAAGSYNYVGSLQRNNKGDPTDVTSIIGSEVEIPFNQFKVGVYMELPLTRLHNTSLNFSVGHATRYFNQKLDFETNISNRRFIATGIIFGESHSFYTEIEMLKGFRKKRIMPIVGFGLQYSVEWDSDIKFQRILFTIVPNEDPIISKFSQANLVQHEPSLQLIAGFEIPYTKKHYLQLKMKYILGVTPVTDISYFSFQATTNIF